MNPQGQQSSAPPAHERKDVDVFGLLMVAALLFIIIAISLLVCWGTLHLLNRRQNAKERRSTAPQTAQSANFPKPQLLVHPGEEWSKVHAAARAQLQTYGWVDRSAGRARIPIERAMELIVERGLPEVGGGQTRLQLMQARPQSDIEPNEASTPPTPEPTP